MAMIKCPECGHDVSDKAKACPHCGFAVADNRPNGYIRVKLTCIRNRAQKVSILSTKGFLWEGSTGQIAEFYLDAPTDVCIKYHSFSGNLRTQCTTYIDPAKGKCYQVQIFLGAFKNKICLNRVDIIDSD